MNETPDTPDGEEDTSGIEQEIASLSILISQARELVADGNTVNLSALSDKIGVFCASVAETPPEDAEGLAVLIEALVTDLNSLGQEITQQSQELSPGGKQTENNGGNGS